MGNSVLFGDTNNAINPVDPACGSFTEQRQITPFGRLLPMAVPL